MTRTPFEIPPGIVSDDTNNAAARRWIRGSNMRFRLGRPQTIGGHEALTATQISGVCRWIFPWTNNAGQLHFGFGTHTKLQVWVGGGLYDITPVGLLPGQIDGTGQAGYGTGPYGAGGYATPSTNEYFPRTWSGGAYGQDLIASPRLDTIYRWDSTNTAAPAVALANAPENCTYVLVNDQRQVMAFGCNEEISTNFNPLAIRFSDIEDPESWTTTPTNNAGELILSGSGGLIGARLVGQYVLAWTNSALYLGTFVGDPTQTWRFDQVGEKCGLMGPNAAIVVGQTAFWLTPDGQFYTYALGGAPQMLPCTVRDEFFNNLALAQGVKIYASSVGGYGEVRWEYPDERDGAECSRYVAYTASGTDSGAWYVGEQARTAMVDAGPAPNPLGVESTIADGVGMGQAYWHERGNSADGAALDWFIETGDLMLSDERQSMMIRDFEPDFKDQIGPVSVTIFTRDYPQDDEETWGPFVFAPGDDFEDFRVEARIARVRYSGSSAPAFARLGRPTFDLVELGRR